MLTFELLNDGSRDDIKKAILHLAIYPRRSRQSKENKNMTPEEIEQDLLHQSKRLKKICDDNGWSYTDYTEIGSGENIDERPKLVQLLTDLEEGRIDGIMVTELSRLTRGGGRDMDRILLTLRRTSTVVLEGENILNPYNKYDLDRFKMMGILSNFEYSGYVERTVEGKRVRASEGWWVSGIPPYGYIRDYKNKKLIIDEEKGKIYRNKILIPYLKGLSTSEIVKNLNKERIPSPRNGMWIKETVIRLLKDETHCGTIIYNKTMGSPNRQESVNRMPYRRLKEEKWSKYYDCHDALKSYEEHEKVLSIIRNRGKKKTKNYTVHPLSGMVKCSSCGKSMIIDNTLEKPRFIKCKCGENGGGETEVVDNVIMLSILKLKEQILVTDDGEAKNREKQTILKEIEILESKIDKENAALQRIDEAVDYGYYTLQQATEKKDKLLKLIYEFKEEIIEKKTQLESFSVMSKSEKLKRINLFLEESNSKTSNEKQREMYTMILKNVIWNKIDNDKLEIKVNFR